MTREKRRRRGRRRGRKRSEAKRRRSKFEEDDDDAMIEEREDSSSVLWSLIVNNNDDICFTHILPRLNGTDLKFLYEVNSETRALVKRSSRASDLKKKFNIDEMSSISTLEVARENKSSWPSHWWKTWFCSRVALTNKLELLTWAREEKKCEWDKYTISAAALKVIWKW